MYLASASLSFPSEIQKSKYCPFGTVQFNKHLKIVDTVDSNCSLGETNRMSCKEANIEVLSRRLYRKFFFMAARLVVEYTL
jgi:hypothetical protein